MELIKVGLIGLGGWGKNIYRNLESLNFLDKVYDKNPDNCRELKVNCEKISSNVDEIFECNEISVVMLATPAITHKEYIIKALENKKHVFVEKPLCLSLQDAYEIKKASKHHKKIVFVGHLLQYHNAFIEMRKKITSGSIGNVKLIKANRLNFGIIRKNESVLYDLGPHDISMILSITKNLPKKVSVNAIFKTATCKADSVNVILYFDKDLMAILNTDWISPYKEHRFSVFGTKGSFIFDDTLSWNNKLIHNPSYMDKENIIHYSPNCNIEILNEEPLKKEILTFINCVKNGEKPYTDIDEAINVQIVLDMIENEMNNKYGIK